MEGEFRINWPALVEEAKQRRKAQRLSQQQLAKLAGVSAPTISHFENGAKDIQLSSIMKIFGVLGMIDKRTLVLRDSDPEPVGVLNIGFEAHDGDKSIKCTIQYEALADHFGANRKSRFEAFEANRERIESEARRKYVAGRLEPDGSIFIRTEDLRR